MLVVFSEVAKARAVRNDLRSANCKMHVSLMLVSPFQLLALLLMLISPLSALPALSPPKSRLKLPVICPGMKL